jgi:hypothetical protein
MEREANCQQEGGVLVLSTLETPEAFFFFVVLGFELRAYTLSHSTRNVLFLIESCELFAWAGFELQSS